MCPYVFIQEEGFSGQYVATPSFSDSTIIAHGPDPIAVLEESKKNGVQDPIIVFIPEKDTTYVY
jgi:hypothetical protein